MKINTNRWNKLRYTLYTPFYDYIANYFNSSRKKSISALKIKPGAKVLIIGAGTGLDLEHLPVDCEITATDITPSMIDAIKQRNKKLNRNINTIVMDGQNLSFADETFDIVILHLILAVIPDPNACIKEAERVLNKGGQIAVFDKFIPKSKSITLFRKLINVISNLFFSDITRQFETIIAHTQLKVTTDKAADFNGNFRLIQLHKPK